MRRTPLRGRTANGRFLGRLYPPERLGSGVSFHLSSSHHSIVRQVEGGGRGCGGMEGRKHIPYRNAGGRVLAHSCITAWRSWCGTDHSARSQSRYGKAGRKATQDSGSHRDGSSFFRDRFCDFDFLPSFHHCVVCASHLLGNRSCRSHDWDWNWWC